MVTSEMPAHLTLHVFEQSGGWQWGITTPRVESGGFKVIAYSEATFAQRTEALHDGNRVLDALVQSLPVR